MKHSVSVMDLFSCGLLMMSSSLRFCWLGTSINTFVPIVKESTYCSFMLVNSLFWFELLLQGLTTWFLCGQILRCINQLSQEPNTLEPLQRADAIKHLVPFLEQQEGLYVDMIQNEVTISFDLSCLWMVIEVTTFLD